MTERDNRPPSPSPQMLGPEGAQKHPAGSCGGILGAAPWQPINTAPKDGSFIDLWVEFYDQPEDDPKGPKRWTDCHWNGEQWENREGFTPDQYMARVVPTHWMSEPSAPADQVVGVTLTAETVIAMRDALIRNDVAEAYYQLYQAVDPAFCRYEPWADTEAQLRPAPADHVVGSDLSLQAVLDEVGEPTKLPELAEAFGASSIPPHVRNFLGKMQGVCLGVAMSGDAHPNPDEALMELYREAQAILFPETSK